ncbi:helix-turn-helix domain-containing protein [Psychrobacillus sp. FSL K6-2843]|uniref:helix-turn-helix domain-containing protein n=1 Tax=Psychrobacillus sp. FSL K6-2843 TaxID=2921549 RepID=UPI003159C3F5
MKLLIIDRDQTERNGIQWYIKRYQLNITTILEAGNINEAVQQIEAENPEVILLEMELLTQEESNRLSKALLLNSQHIIGMTAEPLFKHALNALSLRALTLLVKPLDLNMLKQYITHAIRQKINVQREVLPLVGDHSIYPSLFLEKHQVVNNEFTFCLMLETEFLEQNEQLFHWLESLNHLTLLPLSKRIVAFSTDDSLEGLTKRAKAIIREWTSTHNANLNIAIYDLPRKSIKEMYQAIKETLKLRFQHGFGQVFLVSKLPKFHSLDPFLTIEQQRLWITSLEQNDVQTIKRFLYSITANEIYYQPDTIRIQLTSILAQVRRFMLKYQMEKRLDLELRYNRLFDIILNHPVLYTIIQEFVLFCQDTMNQSIKQKEKGQFDYVNAAIDFIDYSYTDPKLNLEVLASFIGISQSYLSMLFSQTKEMTFKQYLNQKRLTHAKQLLQETNLTIHEIASKTGFNDANYFSKLFKGKYGESPLLYRQHATLSIAKGAGTL